MSQHRISPAFFCCSSAVQKVDVSNSGKVYHNIYHAKHDAIFRSFLEFAARRQRSSELLNLLWELPDPHASTSTATSSTHTRRSTQASTAQPHTPTQLLANPLDPQSTKSVVYMTSRQDFGPVLSHRYFAEPDRLDDDWVEVSQPQWWAAGAGFAYTADKLDLKCRAHERFFRLQLRPNLLLRDGPVQPRR
ncbi:hypothetical protein PVAG01_04951 [Phlyctema vagabunda]|uniref:Uncharacterized protein n=1 Tax=Phlyctema vagabunda TaxID=108571 RepID=A0ABR4PIR7_9HELO